MTLSILMSILNEDIGGKFKLRTSRSRPLTETVFALVCSDAL